MIYQLKLYIYRRRLILMNLHRRLIIRALIFLLLAGPLQVQQVFACGMMDAIFLDDCCCEDHNRCTDSDCGDVITTGNNPCCEESIELNFNNEANEELAVIKSVEIRSDVDPPPVNVFAAEQFAEPIRITVTNDLYSNSPFNLGSNTYLITQRLRI